MLRKRKTGLVQSRFLKMPKRGAPACSAVFAHDRCLLLRTVALIKLLNAAGSVNQLLLAGKKAMAGGADFNPDLFYGGARLKSIAAGAGHRRCCQCGMDAFFHVLYSL